MADLSSKCPGQDLRFLTVDELNCPDCGYRVEFFSDERARKCPQCGHKVDRTRQSNCADWCPAAASCALLRGAGDVES